MSGNSVGLYGSTSTANVAGGNVTGLYRQTQSVQVDDGYNDADVAAFLQTYTGNIQCGNIDVLANAVVGNILTDNYYWANGTPIDLSASYGNSNVAAFLPTYTGNLSGGNLSLTGSQVTSGNATVSGNITSGGYIQAAGNIRTTGVSGNITGADYVVSNYFVGDGSLLSNVTGSYGNANVANYLAAGTNTANIITTGNISGSYILGNGSQLTGLPATYSNTDVATFLANFGSNTIVTTGNITGGNFIGSGATLTNLPAANISGQVANALVAGTVYTAAQPNITSVGTLSSLAVTGNITANNISTTGNVTVSGSLESDDITATDITVYGNQVITGNLTVQGNTTTINSNVITTNDKTITVANNQSTGANVNGAGLEAGNPAVATWLYNAATDSWQSNIAVTPIANLTQSLGTNTNRWVGVYTGAVDASGNITTTANISGSYILGNGSQLTGLPASYGNANVTTLLASFGSNTIVTTGNITGGNFIGSGATLTNLPAANIIGTVANAAYATDSAHATVADSANAVAGGNVTGQVANALVAGTVYTAAQPNITSVGTLSSLAVTGNVTTANSFVIDDGAGNVGSFKFGTATFGPFTSKFPIITSDTANTGPALWNNSGTSRLSTLGLGGFQMTTEYGTTNRTLLWNSGNLDLNGSVFGGTPGNIINVNTYTGTGNITTTANVTGSYILGNGSQLTGLPATYGNADVVSLLAAFGSNTISTTGNITAGNLLSGVLQATTSAGGALKNASGTSQMQWGGGGGNNVSIDVSTNLNGTNAQIDISPTGTGHVYIKPAGTGAVEIAPTNTGSMNNMVIGNVTPAAANVTTLNATGNITSSANISGSYILGNGSQLTGLPAGYSNADVATFLAAFGSNTIVTTGNITGGNLISGAVTYTPTDGTNGQVLTTYGNGVTYFSTVSGGGGSLSGNLAGNIFANGYAFTSTANGNVTITADGTGLVNISKARLETYLEVLYAIGNTSGNLAANANILLGSIQTATLTGNITLDSITNIAAGQNITLILTQDATGNRILSSTMKYAGAYKTLSTAANATDILSIFYDGTNYWASLNIGYA